MKITLAAAALCAAMLAGTVAQAGAPMRLTFDNASDLTIKTLQIRIAGGKVWGSDRLAGHGLAPHAKQKILIEDGSDKCVLEYNFTSSDGKAHELLQSMCANRTFTFYGRS